jgi:hypothetical protein
MTNVRGNPARVNRETIISDTELEDALSKADKLTTEYFRLRAKAVVSLSRLSGKRRGELALIPRRNFKTIAEYLEVTFILEKKRTKIVLNKVSTKRFYLTDSLTQNVLAYLSYLDRKYPKADYWLPSGKMVFGNYTVYTTKHVSSKTVFNIIRSTSETIWPHLNRETVAADVVTHDSSFNAIFKVQETLDLDPKRGFETAVHYIRRYGKQVIKRQQQT